jgi:peptidyl-prolyl cis-trans isomerase A (cyclophilin A)
MKRRLSPLSCLLLLLLAAGPAAAQPAADPVYVRIATEMGDIDVALYADRAPVTVANFLRYVDAGYYDGGSFFRTVRDDNQAEDAVRIAVVQAGGHPWKDNTVQFPPIPLERTSQTGLRHRDGTISMARGGPDTATTSFFLCVGEQPELDFGGRRNPDGQGFAAFGAVVEGHAVVRRIHQTRADGQALLPPVRILHLSRLAAER